MLRHNRTCKPTGQHPKPRSKSMALSTKPPGMLNLAAPSALACPAWLSPWLGRSGCPERPESPWLDRSGCSERPGSPCLAQSGCPERVGSLWLAGSGCPECPAGDTLPDRPCKRQPQRLTYRSSLHRTIWNDVFALSPHASFLVTS